MSWLLAGQTPEQICNNFLMKEVPFFALANISAQQPAYGAQQPAYDIEKVVLAQFLLHGDKKLREVNQHVLFTAFNVGKADTPWRPLLFNNLSKSTNADTTVVDAVVSSGAMPGMLGSHQGNVDGAFVHHDPTLAAIALAVHEGIRLDEIVVICIGTGFMANYIASDTSTWGAQQWQNGDGNDQNKTPALLVGGTVSPILNISLNGTSTNLVPDLAAMMLPGRYAYLNPTLDWFIPENETKPADLDYLQAAAETLDICGAKHLLEEYWPESLAVAGA